MPSTKHGKGRGSRLSPTAPDLYMEPSAQPDEQPDVMPLPPLQIPPLQIPPLQLPQQQQQQQPVEALHEEEEQRPHSNHSSHGRRQRRQQEHSPSSREHSHSSGGGGVMRESEPFSSPLTPPAPLQLQQQQQRSEEPAHVPVLTSIIISAPPTRTTAATPAAAAAPVTSTATTPATIAVCAMTPPTKKVTAVTAAAVTGRPLAPYDDGDDEDVEAASIDTQPIEVPTPRKKSHRRGSRSTAPPTTTAAVTSAASNVLAQPASATEAQAAQPPRRDRTRAGRSSSSAAAAAATTRAGAGRAAAPLSWLDRDYEDDPEGAAAAMRALEAQLPRPEWYTSSEDDNKDSAQRRRQGQHGGGGDELDELESSKSELRARPEGSQLLLHVYTALCVLAFIFSLVATCPVPWLRARRGGRVYTLWRASGGGVATQRVADIHDCSEEQQYWQATSAFAVLSTVASCASVVAAVLLCIKLGHLGACAVLSFYGVVFSLVAWALAAALYNYRRCDKGAYARGIARLDAGFVLMLIVWLAHMAGLCLLAVHFVRYYTRSVHGGKTHVYRFVHVALLCVVMLCYCLGPAYTLWARTFDVVTVRVTLWHVEVHDTMADRSTYITRRAYQCTTLTRRMKVVAGFMIMSAILLFFALMFAMRACYVAKSVRVTNLLTWTTAVFALVAWIVLIVIRHSHLCTGAVPPGASLWTSIGYNGIPTGVNNAQVRYDGYAYGVGFGLILAGWSLNVIAGILGCIF